MFLYPEAPKNINPQKLLPSANFKKQVTKVMLAIIAFLIVYLLLIIAAIFLAIICFYVAAKIGIALKSLLGIIFALGIMALGISVIIFLVKFIFAVSKDVNVNRVEINESEQPELFAFIKKLTEETKTKFPKKIVVSPDVNACVFYNSSFWSMFLPVRKNLEIGLGLINSINIGEFKAVMAHEFGHFSQRSMKLGSFTYNVNRIIYNMLYENKSYTSFLNSWARIHGYLAIFATLTVKIAEGIQWVLKEMYKVVNKNYMGLSREMEFHADAISASVSGGNNLITALTRIELASACYQNAINKADNFLKQQKISRNIFDNQLTIYQHTAKEYNLQLRNGLPEISPSFIKGFSKSRINYTNQWASHPTLQERAANLEQLNMDSNIYDTSAWVIFKNAAQMQEQLTANLYREIKLDESKITFYNSEEFEESYEKEVMNYLLPIDYKGFYDKRFVDLKEWNLEKLAIEPVTKTFDDLFNDENAQLQTIITTTKADIQTVMTIKDGNIDVASFDFDGEKYSKSDCETVLQKLQEDLGLDEKKQQSLDKAAFTFFCLAAKENVVELKVAYANFRNICSKRNFFLDIVQKVFDTTNPLYQNNNRLDFIIRKIDEIKNDLELKLKKQLRDFVNLNLIANNAVLARIENFLSSNYGYFINKEFQNNEINELRNLNIDTLNCINEIVFSTYKSMLELQLALYKKTL